MEIIVDDKENAQASKEELSEEKDEPKTVEEELAEMKDKFLRLYSGIMLKGKKVLRKGFLLLCGLRLVEFLGHLGPSLQLCLSLSLWLF